MSVHKIMDYTSEHNRDLLIERMTKVLRGQGWLPLTFDASWASRHCKVQTIWEHVCLTREDFEGLVTFHGLWSGYGVRKWSTVFERWGFSTFSEELYGEDHVRWVNFGDTADVDDIPRFYAGTVDKNRSEFVGSGGAGRGAGGAGGALDEGDIVLPVVKLVPGVWYHLAVRHGAASGAAGRGGGWLSVPKLFARDQLTVMVDSAVRLERELPVPHLKRDKHRLERPAVGRGLNGQLASIYFFKEALPLALLHQLRDATSGLGAAFRSRSLSGRVGGASAAAAAAAQAAAASSAVGVGGRRSVPPDMDPLFDPGRQGLAERLLAVFNPKQRPRPCPRPRRLRLSQVQSHGLPQPPQLWRQ